MAKSRTGGQRTSRARKRTRTVSRRRRTRSAAYEVEQFERMKRFIRARCDDYLQDDNINSLGIGWKNGNPAAGLAVTFAVDRKVGLESLESVSDTVIPPTIPFEGV